jgi:diaminohydroxyphosphoribosylaminopyrimidine deaminase/5-amino-6-(5-phosphoribosylamino)uracil reductase
VENKIKNVIYAVSDPNPQAAGGAEYLRSIGVAVQAGICEKEAAWSNRAWLTKVKLGRPRLIWKVAVTLDARVNASDGSSQWISGEDSRKKVSHMRNKTDAILAGTGTVLADNPSFNVRREYFDSLENLHNPERVIFGSREIPLNFAVHDGSAPTAFIDGDDFDELLRIFNKKGYNEVMVESGSTLGTALMKANLIDELHLFIAPKLLGAGKSFLGDIGISNISQALNLEIMSMNLCGNDIEAIAVIHNSEREGK